MWAESRRCIAHYKMQLRDCDASFLHMITPEKDWQFPCFGAMLWSLLCARALFRIWDASISMPTCTCPS